MAALTDSITSLENTSPLSSLLCCPVCLDKFEDPKILPCHHSFCKRCIDLLPSEIEDSVYTVKCPTCRKKICKDGSNNCFPPSFLLNNLLELQRNRTRSTSITSSDSDDVIVCPEHDKPCEIFCEDCQVAICHHCLVRSHQKHSHCLVTDCYSKSLNCVETMVGQLRKVMTQLEQTTKTLGKVEQRMLEQEREVEEAINMDADEQIMKINQHRQELLAQARTATERKIKMIQFQKEEATWKINQLKSCEETVDKVLCQRFSKPLFLESRKETVGLIESTLKRMELDTLEPAEKADLNYLPKLTKGHYLGKVDGSFINESLQGSSEIVVAKKDKQCHVVIYNESKNTLFKPSIKIFSYRLIPAKGPPGEETKCYKAEYYDDLNMCQLYFVPTVSGPNHLVINAGGHPIKGSPFPVYVFPQLRPHKSINNVQSPRGVAVTLDGTVVITEHGGNKVRIFYPSDRKTEFPCQKPVGVAATPDGYILVADESSKQVKKYDFTGRLFQESECSLTSSLKNPLAKTKSVIKMNTPQGVVVLQDGRVYVSETGTGTLHEMNPNLSIVRRTTGLSAPTGIATDSKGNVYITSKSNHNIIKYNTMTSQVEAFGTCSKGTAEGQLRRPLDLAIDHNDIIYVADTDNHRISVFDSNGRFLMCFGQKGNKVNELNEPSGITVDQEGRLYVCDTGNNRVIVYQ